MRYHFKERPAEHEGSWFDHHLELYLDRKNRPSLIAALNDQVGEEKIRWAFVENLNYDEMILGTPKPTIMFLDKRELIMFKLTWDEDTYQYGYYDLFKYYTSSWSYTRPLVYSTSTIIRSSHIVCFDDLEYPMANPCSEIPLTEPKMVIDFSKVRGGKDEDQK